MLSPPCRNDGRGVYFRDPNGHSLEVITRPYGTGGCGSAPRVGGGSLPHQWTAEGKDLRAYAVQAWFNGAQIRINEACYRKTVSFKGVTINHRWTQLNSFVLGDIGTVQARRRPARPSVTLRRSLFARGR